MSDDATLDEFVEIQDSKRNDSEESAIKSDESHPRFGKLPPEWSINEIADIAEVVGGSTPSTDNDDYWGGGIPWATPTDITALSGNTISETADTITEEGLESASTHLLPPHSVLMTSRASIGKCAVNTVEMATNQGFKNLVPEKEIETWYLYYRMLETANFLNSVGSGSTFDEVSKTEVQSVDIPIPPLPEQRKIATVLYTVDRAIEKSKEIKTQLERTHNGLIQDFLTHGIQDSETIDTGTKLGEAPSHWEIVTIENILSDEDYSFTDGARYSLSSDEIQGSGDARAILLEEVKEGEFDDSNPKFATEEKYNEITHRAIYPGEVVVAKMAEPVARACIVPDTYEKYLLGCADVVRIVPNEEIEDRFLMYCMNSHKVWRQAVAHLRGTGRSRINLENISELYIPKPPLSEQREIVSILSRIDQKIDNEQQYQDNLQRLKRGLQQDLLSGTVRTTNSNIEVPDEIAQHG
ncbi:restriction endonuclease subunit S [Halorubrum ezzemoulense]|uniref:restriction endonuclease subunit S n=1 Tax=Halorubrum ezzemoulense TaxID=337243 RepID=UPI00232E069B|nr:restriction endonuclease subunit S [Halorubrum ezzemoulense]MDB2261830.1 restriction endonuclease subunit S [Halorubrum ezzemoulense]MDB2268713.1 restriction endonuclease subunit S [Halorubrum ezzemoulense]